MIVVSLELSGSGYTQEQALAMKAEILAYAETNGLKGVVRINEVL